MNRDDPNWNNCTCPICGKKFHLKASHVKTAKNHYCSRKCFYEAKKEYMKGKGNHQFGLKGSKNASWKSDRKLSRYGYIQVRCLDHPFRDKQDWVFEHRLVAEEYLLTPENSVEIDGKRYLSPNYQVHHKNFDRLDNRPENLEVITPEEHMRIHTKLNPISHDEMGRFKKQEPELIKVKRVTESAVIPQRQSIGAAGFDLCADIAEDVEIPPHGFSMIYSGIAFEIPHNYFGAIYARSGLATRQGLRPATCVSVIDSDYRGNVGLPMFNDSSSVRVIHPKERIAQIVFQKALMVDLVQVDSLSDSERGNNGFGSTGR